MFLRDGADFAGRFFIAETHFQVLQRHAPVPGVEPERQRAARAPNPGDELSGSD